MYIYFSCVYKYLQIAQINAEWKNSLLKELRDQLFLLSQYLSIIDECKKNIGLQNSIIFTTSYSEVNRFLHMSNITTYLPLFFLSLIMCVNVLGT